MFTGIVEELGRVHRLDVGASGTRLEIECKVVLEDAIPGASIAVNGCCLTVVEAGPDWWAADVQPETLTRTTLGTLAVADPVNLERPLRLADRLGGHLVQGHVDATGEVLARVGELDDSARLSIAVPPPLERYLVEKGSVTVDGVSLTVTSVEGGAFEVALIPHTLDTTTLGCRNPGDAVNIEVDVLAKYAETLLRAEREGSTHE